MMTLRDPIALLTGGIFRTVHTSAATGDGPITKPVGLLRDLVAASATFQAVSGSADATEALGRIHAIEYDVGDVPKAQRPNAYAVISLTNDWRSDSRAASGSRYTFRHSGTVWLALDILVPSPLPEGYTDGWLWTLAQVEQILIEMEAGMGGQNALWGRGWTVDEFSSPDRPTLAQVGDRRRFAIGIPWGAEA
jgi:hypothetical protein